MIGSPKMYRIWSQLKDIPHRWIDVMEVGRLTNLTCRQVSALVGMMPEGLVQKRRDPDSKAMQLCLDIDDSEIPEKDVWMKSVCYQIKPENKEKINALLSTEEWISINSLCEQTGLERKEVSQAISIIPGVEIRYRGKITVYRKR